MGNPSCAARCLLAPPPAEKTRTGQTPTRKQKAHWGRVPVRAKTSSGFFRAPRRHWHLGDDVQARGGTGGFSTFICTSASEPIKYVVDGKNRRVGKKVNGVTTQAFLYESQLRVAAELDGAGSITSLFVYSASPNSPDYLVKGGTTYRVVKDQLGSSRIVVDSTTGVAAQRMDFDEFGVVTMETPAAFQPFGFAGGIYDQHTKLTRFGARDYEASTGRWTSKDGIRFGGGSTGLYEYVGNDPVNARDFSGFSEGEFECLPDDPGSGGQSLPPPPEDMVCRGAGDTGPSPPRRTPPCVEQCMTSFYACGLENGSIPPANPGRGLDCGRLLTRCLRNCGNYGTPNVPSMACAR